MIGEIKLCFDETKIRSQRVPSSYYQGCRCRQSLSISRELGWMQTGPANAFIALCRPECNGLIELLCWSHDGSRFRVRDPSMPVSRLPRLGV